jgi:hypothetical protein
MRGLRQSRLNTKVLAFDPEENVIALAASLQFQLNSRPAPLELR